MKTLEQEPLLRTDPRRMSADQLARLGVQILNRYDLLLKCVTCGETWSTRLDDRGMLPAAYWHCPNKCNA